MTVSSTAQRHLHGDILSSDLLRLSSGVAIPAMLPKFVQLLWKPFFIVIYRSQEFQFGRTTFEDSDRSGRPRTVATEPNIAKVKCLIKEDPRIRENVIKDSLSLSSVSLNRILRRHRGGGRKALHAVGVPQADRGRKGGVGRNGAFRCLEILTEASQWVWFTVTITETVVYQ